jgi:hypothetical protein
MRFTGRRNVSLSTDPSEGSLCRYVEAMDVHENQDVADPFRLESNKLPQPGHEFTEVPEAFCIAAW